MLEEWERGFLAGMIEGEGYLYALPRKDGFVNVGLQINNTSESLLRTVRTMFLKVADPVGYYSMYYKNFKRVKNQPLFSVRVSGQSNLLTMLPLIIPYLVSKKRDAELLLEYVTSRQSHPRARRIQTRDTKGRIVHWVTDGWIYTPRERAIIGEFKERKRKKGGLGEHDAPSDSRFT